MRSCNHVSKAKLITIEVFYCNCIGSGIHGKSDLARIETYQINKFARNRVLRLKQSKLVGRGTTMTYYPLTNKLLGIGKYLSEIIDPATLPNRRLFLLKQHPSWWPQFVESTFRGECERLKALHVKSPSASAEEAVAKACCISTSSVRRLCIAVRKDPVSRADPNRAMTVADFENWKKSGEFPSEENMQKT